MKDCDQETLESARPTKDALECVEFCLQQLYADREKGIMDKVAGCCTYEELIGALLLCKDMLEGD